MPSSITDTETLRSKIIGLGESSMRKSYYPELQRRVRELEELNRELRQEVRKRSSSEAALRQTEDKFRALFMAMTEMVAIHEVVFDDTGKPVDYRIVDCNDAYQTITGIDVAEVIGKNGSEIYGMMPPPYFAEFTDVAITGISRHMETYYAPMDKIFSISIVSPGQNIFATITTDVTDIERNKETILRKNRELENYLYIASHDLRAPLVNIQGFGVRLKKETILLRDALSSVPLPDDVKATIGKLIDDQMPKTLDFILSNVVSMDRLINGLLALSRTGRIEMRVERQDMNALFRSILDNMGFQIGEARAEVSLGNVQDCYGDEAQLMQLFSNLVGNALKYRDPSRALKIGINSQQKAHSVVYRIDDTGLGISERHRERIFDVFYRIRSDASIPGEGIGLSIVKRIVDRHRGSIWVESEEGMGSRFFVELPSVEFRIE